jgi:hypothetical protein
VWVCFFNAESGRVGVSAYAALTHAVTSVVLSVGGGGFGGKGEKSGKNACTSH